MAKTFSWKQLVINADPEKDKPKTVYKFGKGREFKDRRDPYESAKN